MEEKIFFIDNALPELPAGKYAVTANVMLELPQQAKAKKNSAKTSFVPGQKVFHIDAPRFSLKQEEIYATYPAESQASNFKNTLPHIVFNRKTLPWERLLETGDEPSKRRPWMCLLLVSDEEAKAVTRLSYALADYPAELKAQQSAPLKYLLPELELMPWEDPALKAVKDKKLDVIEVAPDLLQKICPKNEALPFLAHVRKITSEQTGDAFFSVSVSSRSIPETTGTQKYTAYLVSLEGHTQLLKNGPGVIPVRFFVLHAWSFYTTPGPGFYNLCSNLQPSALKVPAQGLNAELARILDRGYLPMPHVARNGAKMVSLYRGPLAPHEIPADANVHFFNSADEALRFDPDTGIFDVSYAAAWQLGRLLALKDKEFSKNLFRWQQQHISLGLEKERLGSLLDLLPAFTGEVVPEGKSEEGHFSFENFLTGYIQQDKANRYILEKKVALAEQKRPEFPDLLKDWLRGLASLKPVPVNYLVPDAQLLPEESLSVFVPDNTWIDALLGGALSIAHTIDTQLMLSNIRVPDSGPGVYELRSGFMLRSQVIRGWKGVKVVARNADKRVVEPLRVEILPDDILLCFFKDRIASITIVQPPESIHFEVKENEILNFSAFTGPADFASQRISRPIEYSFQIKYSY